MLLLPSTAGIKCAETRKGEPGVQCQLNETGRSQHAPQQAHFTSCLAKKTEDFAAVPRAESCSTPSYPAQMKEIP